METATLNGTMLDYEVEGTGAPLLLISTGPIADSFRPFLSAPVLTERYRLIGYRQRGQRGRGQRGAARSAPVPFAEHAADAAALLDHLGVRRAHVAGHSTGGDIALQLALDRPDLVHSLVLLEPALMGVPAAGAFFDEAAPALAAYAAGQREEAMALFMSLVASLDWDTCRAVIDAHVPGGVAAALAGADTFFGGYLPALGDWAFGAEEAAALSQPVLSVLGTATNPLFVDGRTLLRSWFGRLEEHTVEGLGHLLHVQDPEPVLQGVAAFLARHPLEADRHEATERHLASA